MKITIRRGKLLELFEDEWSFVRAQTILVSPTLASHLGTGEEVHEVAGGAGGMGEDRIGEVGDRASEGKAAGVYGAGFTAGCG